MFLKINQDYLRSLVFGFQDALVSTTGVIVGISVGVSNKQFIILSALIVVSVEAMSMAAGQYLSEKSVHDLPQNQHRDNLLIGSLLMFISYLIGGLIPMLPVFFTSPPLTSIMTIIFAFIGLFTLGFLKAKLFTGKVWRSALEMVVIGGLATLIGLLIGSIFKVSI